MTRLACHFTFLRRSFFKDIVGKSPQEEIAKILIAISLAQMRDEHIIEADKKLLELKLAEIINNDG